MLGRLYSTCMASSEKLGSLEKQNEFKTPYCNVTLKEFAKSHPEQRQAFKTVLGVIDAEGIKSFDVFKSKKFPGVAFSFTKHSITPALIEKLATRNNPQESSSMDTAASTEAAIGENSVGKEEELNSKKHHYYLFAGFAPPPDGNAFTAYDVAIDRYVRLIPRVAGPISRGERPPEVEMYVLGAPTGLGGSVTPEWTAMIGTHGFEKYGELYAEFIQECEAAASHGGESPHIVLQGVSKGALVAEKTSGFLPEHLQTHTQRLLDNPAGDHAKHPMWWLKGAEVAAGFVGESVARALFDDTMKSLMKLGGKFTEYLAGVKSIPKDDPEQSKLKWKAATAEIMTLIKGTSMDTDNTRSFIRRAMYDSATFNPVRLLEIWQKSQDGKRIQFYDKGRSLEAPFKGHHMLFYDRHERWSTILDFAEKAGRGELDWSKQTETSI